MPPKFSWKELFNLLKDAAQAFGEDKAPRLAAALSYYTIFSIAPILFFVVAIVSQFLAADAVKAQLQDFIGQNLNNNAAELIVSLIPPNDELDQSSLLASSVGFIALFMGATTLFVQLQDSLNFIWNVPQKNLAGALPMVISRLQAFALIITFGLIVGFFLLGNTYLSATARNIAEWLQLGSWGIWLVRLSTFLLSSLVLTLMFAAIYKILPNTQLQWRETLVGSVITAVLFNMGQIAIGFYLANFGPQGTFGAASSLVVLLLWINFSSTIFFFGAEITWVYSQRYSKTETAAEPRCLAARGWLGKLGLSVPSPAPLIAARFDRTNQTTPNSQQPSSTTAPTAPVQQANIKARLREARAARVAAITHLAPVQHLQETWRKLHNPPITRTDRHLPPSSPVHANQPLKLPSFRSSLWDIVCRLFALPVLVVFKLLGWRR